ncbi:thiol peroxidase [Clostridium tarantellae]|uniref:Thiol peroxidase n=1 Tax=Clostridium tarantellae TaxID=39493 RepID=A0A6I1MQ78_9CLOT|nr:thiol peroxidase [Clostridium tarantellae]MPQ45214.1 thiol peroxidase [Clostridium tarantellae]
MKVKFKGNELNLVGEQVHVGEKLPCFTVVDNNLGDVSLKDTKGVRIFLSVPSIDTPVCSIEVASFNEKIKELPNITCYTISMDLPFAQSRWCQAGTVENVKVLSDYKNREFAKATGTYLKELGLLTRACFVVNSNDELVYVDYLDEVTNEPDYNAVLEAAKAAK